MTSRTFTGQNYALDQFPSAAGVLRWDASETRGQARDPDRYEGGKTKNGIQHLVGVRAVLGMQIGLDCVIEGEKEKYQRRAAEPCEPGAEEFQRGRRLIRSEPVGFVRNIDQLGGDTLEDLRHAEAENRGHHQGSDEKSEEHCFGLPAVRNAAAVEVRCDLIGQPWIARRKIKRRKNGEQHKQHFGQA